MSTATKIEWTDATWNPLRGCSRVSAGCVNCYAETMANRFSGPGQPYEGLVNHKGRWNGKVQLVEKHLDDPLRWEKPRRVFVNSMSDLFHEAVSDDAIMRIFAVMALAKQHTFQVLTKRPERMQRMLTDMTFWGGVVGVAHEVANSPCATATVEDAIDESDRALSNVWLGVTVENQAAADERIPLLLQTPASVRFLSMEPLLGPVDLSKWIGTYDCNACGYVGFETSQKFYCCKCEAYYEDAPDDEGCPKCGYSADALVCPNPECEAHEHDIPSFGMTDYLLGTENNPMIHWVIVGGESGPGARPMHPDWARSLRDQCQAAGVAFLFKQWGAIKPAGIFHSFDNWCDKASGWIDKNAVCWDTQGRICRIGGDFMRARDEGAFPVAFGWRTDKKAAGNEIDGRTWLEFPRPVSVG